MSVNRRFTEKLFAWPCEQWRWEGGRRGACTPGGTVHLEGRKYGIL